MYLTIFDILIIIGISQGLLAVILLLFSKEKTLINRFLALAILSFCLLFFKIFLNYSGLSGKLGFRYLPNAFELSTAPLFYFYLRALTVKDFAWSNKYLIHFIPFAIAQTYALMVYGSVFSMGTVDLQDKTAHQLYYVSIKEFEDWLIVVSILSYLYLGYRKFSVFHQQVKDNTADSAYPTLNWLRNIIILCAILFVFLLFNMSLSRMFELAKYNELHWKIYYLYQAGLTYYLSFMAYHQKPPDLSQITPSHSSSVENNIPLVEVEQQSRRLRIILEQQKIYLEPTLNINKVAKQMEISSSKLSQIINRHFNKSFRELINEYRIEDIKEKLLDTENKASILSLALESGFNSEASFYRVFKNSVGLTPRDFIKSHTKFSKQ